VTTTNHSTAHTSSDLVAGPVLVTGAAGFVGGHLLEALAPLGLHVEAWTRPGIPVPDTPAARSAEWHDLELLDRAAVRAAVERLRPRTVFHLAGAAHVGDSWRHAAPTLETNVLGTHHLLEADRLSTRQARILIPGSATVYKASPDPLTEESEVAPASPYAVSKLAQEQLGLRAAAEGQHVIVTRSFNHIGPRQAPSFAASSFARQLASIEAGRSEPVIRVGNLSARRDLTDVRDTVRAYVLLASRGRPGLLYNVCSGRAVSMEAVLEQLRARTRAHVSVTSDPSLYRPVDAPLIVGSFARLGRDTGWEPVVPLDRTLDDLLDFWRSAIGNPGA
jgi:GDP-4-dehydro-6-deoxy-D-mannose reductase